MPRKPALRAVAPNETPPAKPKKLTLTEAIEAGEYVEILRAQRRDIVASLPDEKGPAKAALHRQLSLLSKEIEMLATQAGDDGDEDEGDTDDTFDASAI